MDQFSEKGQQLQLRVRMSPPPHPHAQRNRKGHPDDAGNGLTTVVSNPYLIQVYDADDTAKAEENRLRESDRLGTCNVVLQQLLQVCHPLLQMYLHICIEGNDVMALIPLSRYPR